MKLSASLTLSRLEGAVTYGIRLTPASVAVDSLTGAVTPATPVVAVPYRTEGSLTQDIDSSEYNQPTTDSGQQTAEPATLRYVIYCNDGSTIKNNSDTLLPEYIGVPGTAAVVFEYIIGERVVAVQPLQINRSGQTYQPVRIQLWDDIAAGSTLYPGNQPTDPYTDIVFTITSDNRSQYYKCIGQFNKASGSTTQQYVASGKLMAAADYVLIATQVLLAQNAVIRLLQGNKITVTAGGAVTAGMQGVASGVQIWGGSSDPASAPFRVLHDGSIVATKADILGKIAASILDLRVSSGDSGLPDGAICFDRGSITLPELEVGAVRTIKVLNPLITRANPVNLKLIPQNANVYIATDLNYLDATSSTKEIASGGPNGQKYYELLGIRRAGTAFTVWLTREL